MAGADEGPTLSIIIPLYNAEATIQCTLASLEQIAPAHRSRVEVIVVDDGSTDRSLTLVREHVGRAPGFRWNIIAKSNGGASSARNVALRAASGDWGFFLDSDDELALDLVAMLRGAGGHTSLAFALEYRRHGRFWQRVQPQTISPTNWLDVLTAGCPYQPSSLLFRRDCIDHLFEEDIVYGEDWLFWMRNPRLFERTRTFPHTVSAIIHIHGNNISCQFKERGPQRQLVAERVASAFADRLTKGQRNNLYIQARIGRIQMTGRPSLAGVLAFPCDPTLYFKLWVYIVSSALGFEATPYKPERKGPEKKHSTCLS
jgi:hypothetical protein